MGIEFKPINAKLELSPSALSAIASLYNKRQKYEISIFGMVNTKTGIITFDIYRFVTTGIKYDAVAFDSDCGIARRALIDHVIVDPYSNSISLDKSNGSSVYNRTTITVEDFEYEQAYTS